MYCVPEAILLMPLSSLHSNNNDNNHMITRISGFCSLTLFL